MAFWKNLVGTVLSEFKIGRGTAGDKKITANTASVNKPHLIYDDTADKWKVSDDGTNTRGLDEAKALIETAGPTALTLGAVSDGQFLRRDGATIIGSAEVDAGSEKAVAVDINGADGAGNYDSTAQVPQNAIVTKVVTNVTSALDGSATIEVKINGTTPLTVQATTDNTPGDIGVYETAAYKTVTSDNVGVVRATVGGTPTEGAAKIVVFFVTPQS